MCTVFDVFIIVPRLCRRKVEVKAVTETNKIIEDIIKYIPHLVAGGKDTISILFDYTNIRGSIGVVSDSYGLDSKDYSGVICSLAGCSDWSKTCLKNNVKYVKKVKIVFPCDILSSSITLKYNCYNGIVRYLYVRTSNL